MRRLLILLILCALLTGNAVAQNYRADWICINSGGEMNQLSASYAVRLTLAQSVSGQSESDNYRAYLGFWHPLVSSTTSVDQIVSSSVPTDYTLNQNYPNPFNPTTTIEFAIPRSGHVRVDVVNVLGQRVAILADEYLAVGQYRTVWDARNLSGAQVSSGVYFYRLVVADVLLTKKMLLMK